jgi:MoaA/NifB/PqqE/SkfB family radical SAM enzyme
VSQKESLTMPQFKRSNTVELELTSKCALSCSECPRVKQKNDRASWDNGNIDTNTVIQAIDDKIKKIIVCGSYGDAMYHPEVDKVLKSINEKLIPYSMDTNGSYIKDELWERVADHISTRDEWVFSIDGPPHNFATYRVNGHWPSIESGIRILTGKGCQIRWKYIVFKYNSSYEDIKAAYDKAWELGVRWFQLVHTKRASPGQYVAMEEFSDALNQIEDYVGGIKKEDYPAGTNRPPKLRISIHPRIRKVTEQAGVEKVLNVVKKSVTSDGMSQTIKTSKGGTSPAYKMTGSKQTEYYSTKKVYPQCVNVDNWAQFIGSDGIYYPCCYARSEKSSLVEGAGLTEEDLESMSVYNHTIDEIVVGSGYQKLMANFDNISVCTDKCPAKI